MPGFNEKTASGLENAVRDLKRQIGPGLKGYVLDLRNNPGGLLDQAVQVSDDLLTSRRSRLHPRPPSRRHAALRRARRRHHRRQAGRRSDQWRHGLGIGNRRRRAAGSPPRHDPRHDVVRQRFGADHHSAGRRRWRAASDDGALLHAVRPFDPGPGHRSRYRGGRGRRRRYPAHRAAERSRSAWSSGERRCATHRTTPTIIRPPTAGAKPADFQLSYALDLLHGKVAAPSGEERAGELSVARRGNEGSCP